MTYSIGFQTDAIPFLVKRENGILYIAQPISTALQLESLVSVLCINFLPLAAVSERLA